MTSYEIVKLLQNISSILDEKVNVKHLLSKASEYQSEIARQTDQLLIETHLGQGMTLISQLQRNAVEIYAANFRYARAKAVFEELSQMEGDLEAIRGHLEGSGNAPGVSKSSTKLIAGIKTFSDAYEQFNATTSPSVQLVLSLIKAGDDLNNSIQDLPNALLLAKDSWYPLKGGDPGYDVIDLLLPSASSYEDILAKLIAIDAIYSDLCTLLNVSKPKYPLQVFKIETGTVWLWLSGNSTVVTLLVEFLEGVGSYWGRSLTPEAKIDSTSKKADLINKIWELRDRLEAAGDNTTDLDDRLKKLTNSLADNTIILLGGEPSFSINHQTYYLNKEPQERGKRLQGSSKLFLEDGTQS